MKTNLQKAKGQVEDADFAAKRASLQGANFNAGGNCNVSAG